MSPIGPKRSFAVAKIVRETLNFATDFCDGNSLLISAVADLSREC
jgi:hypothetical protein